MWSQVIPFVDGAVPSNRNKHGICGDNNNIFILGGRCGKKALKDFWEYSIEDNKWKEIKSTGDRPGFLQDHSMVMYKKCIYIFGGELSFCNDQEVPFWKYDLADNNWRKLRGGDSIAPKGLRGHSMSLYGNKIYIYGGYQELLGCSTDIWCFNLESCTWSMLNQVATFEGILPKGRYNHSAVLHDSNLWIYGGMTGLQESQDFFMFNLVSLKWTVVNNKGGPGCLHSHNAVRIRNTMLILGGIQDGKSMNMIWRFHFDTQTWNVINTDMTSPLSRIQHRCFVNYTTECDDLTLATNANITRPSRTLAVSDEEESVDIGPVCRFNSANNEVLIQFSPASQQRNANINLCIEKDQSQPPENKLYPNLEQESSTNSDDPPSNYASLEDLEDEQDIMSDEQCLIAETENHDISLYAPISMLLIGGASKDQVDWKRESISMWKLEINNIL